MTLVSSLPIASLPFECSVIDHPNLAKFYGITPPPVKIVMEYLPGKTLLQVLEDNNQSDPLSEPYLTLKWKLRVMRDIANAMRYDLLVCLSW